MNTFKHLAMTAAVALFVLSFNLRAQMNHESMKPKGEQKSSSCDTTRCNESMNDMSQTMGKPTFEQTVNGQNVRVWLITQEEHKKMMESMMKDSSMSGEKHEMGGMKHGDMDMKHDMKGMDMKHDMKGMDMKHSEMGDKEMMEKMMSGTHHIMVVLTDEKSGEPVKNAVLEVTTLSPTKKASHSELKAMMGHFGGNLELGETGEYDVALAIKVGAGTSNVKFFYTVK